MTAQVSTKGQSANVCALCLKPAVLVDSHLLPAFAYKAVKQNSSGSTVVVAQNATLSIDFQITDLLLCADCDGKRFGPKEDYVAGLIRRPGDFPLLTYVKRGIKLPPFSYGNCYMVAGVSEIDVATLAYFATSIFWRGAVHIWPNMKGNPPISCPTFGPYCENLRRYLLDEIPFPKEAVLWIDVLDNEPGVALHTPQGQRVNDVKGAMFEICGIRFIMFFGKLLSQLHQARCVVSGDRNPIVILDGRRAPPNRGILNTIRDSPRRGKFAQTYKRKP